MTRSAKQPPEEIAKAGIPEKEYSPTNAVADSAHDHLTDKLEVLHAFLTTVFSEAAEAGLTKQEVMHAVLRHHTIIGEPPVPSLELPERAPEVFMERKDKSENALEFLNRVWGPYQDILSREDIHRLGDDHLVARVQHYCFRHGVDPEVVLPPPLRAREDEIVASWTAEEREAARRWAARENTAKYRRKTSS